MKTQLQNEKYSVVLLIALLAASIPRAYCSTLTVTSLADSGPGTLRQALADNSSLGGGNTIVFANTLNGMITLITTELTISAPVFIQGPGPNLIAISGNHNKRVFTVASGPTQISGLTIRDGLVNAGAASQGNDGSNARGGAIFSQSTLTLSNCVIRSNSVIGGEGGERQLGVVGSGGAGTGGGIYSSGGNLFLNNCTFESNTSFGGQGGGASTGDAGDGGNALGGAAYILGGTNQIMNCSFISNSATGGAGDVSTNSGNAGLRGQGYGGGLYNESSLAIFSSTISGGSAAGASSGSSTGSGYGGAIFNGMALVLYSCTIASNSVSGSSFDAGGGIHNVGTAALGVTNCTIAANQSDVGGGINGNATVGGSIIALNNATTGPDVNGTINSSDYNLIQSSDGLSLAGSNAHTILGKNPFLSPLQNNGGPTLTMALQSGSPAIDQGKSFGFITDQRGVSRLFDVASVTNAPAGDGTDIGAYEFIPAPTVNIQAAANNKVVLFWQTNTGDAHLQSATNLSAATNWSDITNARVYVGSQAYVTNSATGPGRFYRLVLP